MLSQGAFNSQLMNPKETDHATSKKKKKKIRRMSGEIMSIIYPGLTTVHKPLF